VSPALSKPSGAEGHQNSDREHLRVAFGLRGGMVEERADASILFMDEVPRRSASARSDPRPLKTNIHQIFSHIVQPGGQ
jgi:hypothetical protein